MSIKTVWAAFFSATDTTKKVVTRIAARLAEQTGAELAVWDFTLPGDRKEPKTFTDEDLVVFGTPVYAGRVPNLLIKFVAAVRGGGAIAVPVVCYGNRNYDPKDFDNPDDVMPTLGAKNGLTLTDLAGKPYDDPQWEQLLDQLSIQDMITLINTAGWNTAAIESVGKVATSEFDGPSGYSNYLTGSMGTQFCTEVLLAQTWNKALAEKVGDAIAQEFASANSFGWYGPAMNLHRSAFSGRNFEY